MTALTETRATGMVNLAPQTFAQALEFAGYLADSDMVPKDFKGKPGNCLIAMQWGSEVGLQALQALQSIAVINGRPTLWGDGLIALVRASPACEYILEEDDGKMATCRVKRRGEPEQARTFSMDDAKAAGLAGKPGPWTQYPKRMRRMRARAFALRDVFPDVLRGMPVAEEVMDIPKDMGKADVVEPTGPSPSAELLKQANEAAAGGATSYQKFWSDTGKDNRKLLAGEHERLKATAADVDKARTVEHPAEQAAAAADTGEITVNQVMAKINAATNEDALYVAADWINAITNNADVANLNARFDERLAELRS